MSKPKIPAPKRKSERRSIFKSTIGGVTNFYRRGKDLATNLLFNPEYTWWTGVLLLILESIICILVVRNVKYTEIDWSTYMQQVEMVLNGTRSYPLISGDTGPIPYPAGHVWIFSALYYVTNRGLDIRLAQYIFVVFYVINLAIVLRLYHHCKKVPPIVLILTSCTSYRVHSIFILRLFNDPLASMFLYAAILLLIDGRFVIACMVYSLAVSIKMNILLYAPALFVILIAQTGYIRTIFCIFVCGIIQLLVATPFLLGDPIGYISRAFNLGRVFLFEWTVNWRFLSEEFFTDRRFHLALLACHLLVLVVFAFGRWLRNQGGLSKVLKQWRGSKPDLSPNDIVNAMFTSNFIGIMFSRSLHYQFYVWYYHTLPYLVWSTDYPTVVRLLILGVIELCWNTFPSTNASSALLHLSHLTLLLGLWFVGKRRLTVQKLQKDKAN